MTKAVRDQCGCVLTCSHLLFCLIYIIQSQHPMWRLGCFKHFGLATINLQSSDNFGCLYQLGTRIIWRWSLRLVLSGPLDQATEMFHLLVVDFNPVCTQLMSSRRLPRRTKIRGVDRVCAHYQLEDQLVRWVSSHSFYLKQMTWSVEAVTRYWRSTMRQNRGRYPHAVPDHIRFCISWLSGIDCTNWTVEQYVFG